MPQVKVVGRVSVVFDAQPTARMVGCADLVGRPTLHHTILSKLFNMKGLGVYSVLEPGTPLGLDRRPSVTSVPEGTGEIMRKEEGPGCDPGPWERWDSDATPSQRRTLVVDFSSMSALVW